MSIITAAELLAVRAPRTRIHLSDEEVRYMRSLFARWRREDARLPHCSPKRRGYKQLGEMFGCAPMTVRDIVQGRIRKDAGGRIAKR